MNGGSIVVTGIGVARGDAKARDDVVPWLVSRKSRKYMGKQDELAVIAAGQALDAAGWTPQQRQQASVYLTVGHIPFEQGDIEAIARHSVDAGGAFDMQRFAREGIEQVNPLLTFRCLPNMPAYHLSLNFDIRGRYVVGYPGIAQCYQALDQAALDLASGRCTRALLGAVADQCNFLVEFYFARSPARSALERTDAAACLCLEREADARDRGARVLARLADWRIDYDPTISLDASAGACTDLTVRLHDAIVAARLPWQHAATSTDHGRLSSRWDGP